MLWVAILSIIDDHAHLQAGEGRNNAVDFIRGLEYGLNFIASPSFAEGIFTERGLGSPNSVNRLSGKACVPGFRFKGQGADEGRGVSSGGIGGICITGVG